MSASDYPKYCEGCKTQINKNDKHFAGIPGVGELCNPCHAEWAEELEKAEMDVAEKKFTKKLCIDFDGVIHTYDSGWKGSDVVADFPVPGAMAWLKEMIADPDMEPMIYSSRSKDPEGVAAMKRWIGANGLTKEEVDQLQFPTQKPAAWLSIDDRGFHFTGEFPTAEFINNFKPWNKQ